MLILAGRSGTGLVSLMTSSSPCALTPDMWLVRPAAYASAPTTSRKKTAPYEWIFGLSTRSIARSNAAAVTGWLDGGEKRYPDRSLMAYVLPPSEMTGGPAATSGRRREPAGNGRS